MGSRGSLRPGTDSGVGRSGSPTGSAGSLRPGAGAGAGFAGSRLGLAGSPLGFAGAVGFRGASLGGAFGAVGREAGGGPFGTGGANCARSGWAHTAARTAAATPNRREREMCAGCGMEPLWNKVRRNRRSPPPAQTKCASFDLDSYRQGGLFRPEGSLGSFSGSPSHGAATARSPGRRQRRGRRSRGTRGSTACRAGEAQRRGRCRSHP